MAVNVLCLFFTETWVGLQCARESFPVHTDFHFAESGVYFGLMVWHKLTTNNIHNVHQTT